MSRDAVKRYLSGKKIQSYPKPKIDKSLKIRQMTGVEQSYAEMRKKYTNSSGKTTWSGAARLIGDVGKTIFRRATFRN